MKWLEAWRLWRTKVIKLSGDVVIDVFADDLRPGGIIRLQPGEEISTGYARIKEALDKKAEGSTIPAAPLYGPDVFITASNNVGKAWRVHVSKPDGFFEIRFDGQITLGEARDCAFAIAVMLKQGAEGIAQRHNAARGYTGSDGPETIAKLDRIIQILKEPKAL